MLRCEQTQGQSVFQHGRSVESYVKELLNYLKGTEPLKREWNLPDWVQDYKKQILENVMEDKIFEYARYHDCGKPYCRTEDDKGVHFPDHANVSREVYLHLGGDATVANLIGWDMCLHVLNAEEIKKCCENQWTAQEAVTLLVAALSEVHSNSRMFGGIESVSFKIKFKQLVKRGKQVLKHYFAKENKNGK